MKPPLPSPRYRLVDDARGVVCVSGSGGGGGVDLLTETVHWQLAEGGGGDTPATTLGTPQPKA